MPKIIVLPETKAGLFFAYFPHFAKTKEFLRRTFTERMAKKKGHTDTRHQGDFISLLTKIREDTQRDRSLKCLQI
jgi:hypothetical protein